MLKRTLKENKQMEKRTMKVSINLTQEQYETLQWLATQERRTISELAALIVVDNSQRLFLERQPQGRWEIPTFCPRRYVD